MNNRTEDQNLDLACSSNPTAEKEKSSAQILLRAMKELPDDWAFVAVNGKKQPLSSGWQNMQIYKQDLQLAAKNSSLQQIISAEQIHKVPFESWQAIGVLCGTPSGGLLFVDHDGASCDRLIEKRSGLTLEQAMPKTLMVISGKPDRYQAIYRVPQHLWGSFKTKRLRTE